MGDKHPSTRKWTINWNQIGLLPSRHFPRRQLDFPPIHYLHKPIANLLIKRQGYLIGTNGHRVQKHYKLILRWWFEVMCNNPESNETTMRPSHSVFQRRRYEFWWVKMHIYNNWARRNYWTSWSHSNEWRNYKPNEIWWVLQIFKTRRKQFVCRPY